MKMNLLSTCCTALLLLSAQLAAAAPYRMPEQIDGDWAVASAPKSGVAATALASVEAKIADGSYPGITSVLLVRHGKLVYEHYANDGARDTLNDMRSATKSITALLVGAAIERKLIADVDAPVYGFFPERKEAVAKADPRVLKITVEDLLTMSSLWECNDENAWSAGNEERMYVTEDWLGFALDLPVKGFAPWMDKPADSPHGRSFSYCTVGSFVLGAVVEQASGKSLAAFAREVLEAPLGIKDVQWNSSPLGIGMGGGGTRYRSRDIARIGEMVLRHGRWNGKQVLPATWIEHALTVHAQAREDADYGYQFWRFRYQAGGQTFATWAMSGNGGNYVFIQPELDLVAVVTSSAYNNRQSHPNSQAIFQAILAGVTP